MITNNSKKRRSKKRRAQLSHAASSNGIGYGASSPVRAIALAAEVAKRREDIARYYICQRKRTN